MPRIRTDVYIETNEILTISTKRTVVRVWCDGCGCEVSMVTVRDAALLSGQDVDAIHFLIGSKHLHFCYLKPETPSVCLRSLCSI
jgi:hypothetical protein